jgi:predicted acyl esterase
MASGGFAPVPASAISRSESENIDLLSRQGRGSVLQLRAQAALRYADSEKAWVFETGANQWHSLDAWPPRGVTRMSLFLATAGKLSRTVPDARAFDRIRE